MITILLQKILVALTQLLGDIKTKLNTIKDNLDDLIVVATASGPIASFTTTITKPFISCKIEIKPKQASGTPTPSNPLPISGTDTVIVTQTDGDNQVITTKTVSLPSTVYGGEVDVIGGSGEVTKQLFTFTGSETWSFNSSNNFFYTTISSWRDAKQQTGLITDNGIKFRIVQGTQYANIIRVYIDDNTSYIDSSTDMTTILTNGTQFVYELATPTQITLANPIELTAINGVNNIFTDSGDVTIEYLKLYKEV